MARIGNDLTQGSVFKRLVMFALPFLAANVVQTLYNVADMIIVGNFAGPASMSGVSIGGQVSMMLTFLAMGFTTGATVLIGQYMGAKNHEGIQKVTATIITFLLIVGVFVMAVTLIFREPILRLIKTPPESYMESARYLTVTAMGTIFVFGYNTFSSILRGMGNSKQPFYFVLLASICNVILDLLFVAVFHWNALGVALATVISQALSMFLCIAYLVRNKFQFDFKHSSFKIHKRELGLITKIGLPACIQNGVTSISLLFVTSLINTVGGVAGSAGVAAVSQFSQFAMMPSMALSMATTTLTAQNIGAGRTDRAIRCCIIAVVSAAVLSTVFFALARIFHVQIISIFNNDPEVIKQGLSYLRSFSFSIIFLPVIMCMNGFITGTGHTLFTMIVSLTYSVLLRVPFSYFFGVVCGWGLFGVGMGSPAGHLGGIVIVVIYLISGKWRQIPIKIKAPKDGDAGK